MWNGVIYKLNYMLLVWPPLYKHFMHKYVFYTNLLSVLLLILYSTGQNKHPDFMALTVGVNESASDRDSMIRLLTENISSSSEDESLEETFRKTYTSLQRKSENGQQTVEFETDLRKKLCLHDVFNPQKKYKAKSGKSKSSSSGLFKRK